MNYPLPDGYNYIMHTTIDLQQAAGTYDLFTGTLGDCLVGSVMVRLPNIDVSDDGAITGISVQTDDVTPTTFITLVSGAVANLTPEKQLIGYSSAIIKVGKKIQLTIAGGPADVSTVCDVYAKVTSIDGGYLA